ncbi:MAG TPA: hypothetical protein VM901_07275 [Bdellovibrionota bacterium]|jgi:hypothetical protein|nr:hypothetical protein [Bdellovibrionota bacterium]
MKKSLMNVFLGAALASSLSAFANDSAVYTLPVQGIDPLDSRVNTDLVKFYGKEASEFMKLLPPVRTVPPVAELVAKHSKELVLRSNTYSLRFGCSDAAIDLADDETPVATPNAKGTECTVSLARNDEGDGDTLEFVRDGGKTAVIEQLSK